MTGRFPRSLGGKVDVRTLCLEISYLYSTYTVQLPSWPVGKSEGVSPRRLTVRAKMDRSKIETELRDVVTDVRDLS